MLNNIANNSIDFLSLSDWQYYFPVLKQPNIHVICNILLNHDSVIGVNGSNNSQKKDWVNQDSLSSIYAMFNSICQPINGQQPPLVLVEHPWQAQWLKQACMDWFKQSAHSIYKEHNKDNIAHSYNLYLEQHPKKTGLMPKVLTLNQWLESLYSQSQANLPFISKQEAALLLCNALRQLNVDSIRNDSIRYQLAIQMVTLIEEIDIRALLSNTLPNAGQTAKDNLLSPIFLSREVQWVSVCQTYLSQIEADTKRQLYWRANLDAIQHTLSTQHEFDQQYLKLIIPAAHPNLLMQVFLSQLNTAIDWINTDPIEYSLNRSLTIILPDIQSDTVLQASAVQTYMCNDFEDEAQFAAKQIQNWFKEGADYIAVVAHDRVLGRRCAALLARNNISVEDRVGWALSTTVAASTVRHLLSSWFSDDFETVLTWLSLPMVQLHQVGADCTLLYLQQVWHKQTIISNTNGLIQRILNEALRWKSEYNNTYIKPQSFDGTLNNQNNALQNKDIQEDIIKQIQQTKTHTVLKLAGTEIDYEELKVQLAVADCLGKWHEAKKNALKLATVSSHAQQLIQFLAPFELALQADSAGIKVWQQLQYLAISDTVLKAGDSPLVSLATFIGVIDQAFETERFSVSTHRYDSKKAARVIFMPFYEVAWSCCKYIMMLGCNDANFPAIPNNPTPLLLSVRRELNLPLPVAERAVWRHLLFNITPQTQLYALFTPNHEGNPSRMSPWLSDSTLHIHSKPVPETVGSFVSIQAEIIPEIPNQKQIDHTSILSTPIKLWSPSYLLLNHLPKEVSVSHLSILLQCPYQFALAGIFKIKPLNEPAIWPSHLERGNLLHTLLHRVHRHVSYSQSLDTKGLIYFIRQSMRDLLQDKLPISGRYAALIADCERTITTYVSAHQSQIDHGWQITATEMPIESLYLIPSVRVYGKIDRVDRQQMPTSSINQDTVYSESHDMSMRYRVLDYKTSNKNTLIEKSKNALLDAQLVLYSVLLILNNKPVEQAAYWRLHDDLSELLYDELPDSPYSKDQSNDTYHSKYTVLEVDNLSQQSEQVLNTLHIEWQHLLNKSAIARPSEQACHYCVYSGVCRNALDWVKIDE